MMNGFEKAGANVNGLKNGCVPSGKICPFKNSCITNLSHPEHVKGHRCFREEEMNIDYSCEQAVIYSAWKTFGWDKKYNKKPKVDKTALLWEAVRALAETLVEKNIKIPASLKRNILKTPTEKFNTKENLQGILSVLKSLDK